MSTKTIRFAGRVGGVTYDDPALFEEAARSLGYKDVMSRGGRWKVGTEVALTVDGERVAGQVWDRGPRKETYWVALENGAYALLGARNLTVISLVDAKGHALDGIGKAQVAS